MLSNVSLADKKVLIRVDYNVPIDDGIIIDNYRIKKSLPTIEHCLNQGASIILISHLGRPKNLDSNYSLLPVCAVNVHIFHSCLPSMFIF